ncbi:putative bifunctional diguanylate cyclase/phosphodiesterase [Sphingomonas baiyangensis]|uniref:EAL domain-containing protein n=1 Tax=Sphingomonas baiyangensis TaxID=2572576 RepID=A0A4U1L8D3_9SPHN|nr:EAL domain-containing protein [Sphingomonas baiyangensis]TKD53219.1 EAL domain-containing protein [Sphingomonas baiyangensis]
MASLAGHAEGTTPSASDTTRTCVHSFGPQVSSLFLDLLPIPAALLVRHADGLQFEGINPAFRRAGLGVTAQQSPLVKLLANRIFGFFDGDERHVEFDWQFGDSVDCRYFRVKLGRRTLDQPVQRCLVTLVDHTSELRTQHSLRREMMTDSLTGLPNRAGFTDQLEAAIQSRSRDHYAVLALNLDRFSRVNACMGGLAGDELLISVARRMKGALRGRDVIARTGGDEFAILMTIDDGPAEALEVAKRIEASLATPFRLSDFEIRVSCSIGIALGADGGSDAEEIVRHAQFAVKRSKKSGRTEVYQTRAFDLARQQFSVETELRRAIDGGALTLSYQPICDLASGRIVAFEALTRWTTERGVALSPCEFIPVAEESGLIVPLGRWAMHEAMRELAAWDAASGGDCGVSVAVNLSAIQLQRDQVATMVRDALDAHGVNGRRLTIELTESAIVADPDRVTHTIRALKDLGTRLAMDDFGTGYSNLAYLQKLPIDTLKIDRSFVSGMLADRDKVAIVRAILSLAQALGMQTTAEGIETNELAQTLAALGCNYGQGFLYARPLPGDQALRLLSSFNQ